MSYFILTKKEKDCNLFHFDIFVHKKKVFSLSLLLRNIFTQRKRNKQKIDAEKK